MICRIQATGNFVKTKKYFTRFRILWVVSMRVLVFCDVTRCRYIHGFFDVSEKRAAFPFKANQSRRNCLLRKMKAPLINLCNVTFQKA